MLEHDGSTAVLPDCIGVMRDEDDRPALGLEPPDPVETLALERLVADGEHLIDEQDLRIGVDGDGEGEPDVHAGRIEFHLSVDEFVDAGEIDDRIEVPFGLLSGEAEDRPVEKDVSRGR